MFAPMTWKSRDLLDQVWGLGIWRIWDLWILGFWELVSFVVVGFVTFGVWRDFERVTVGDLGK